MVAEFSHDGTYVATGDMSGIIQVWRVATQSLIWSDNVGDVSVSILFILFVNFFSSQDLQKKQHINILGKIYSVKQVFELLNILFLI